MLTYVTSLNASGLRDWLVQRVTAVLLSVYTLLLVSFFTLHCSHLTYNQWHAFFMQPWMQVFTLLILMSVLLHAWVGLWIVSTDYVKPACVRLIVQLTIIITLFTCLIAGILIIWGS